MAKRRGNQAGCIYQRYGRWCAQVTADGRRLTHYAKTRRDCREWSKTITAQIDQRLTAKGAQSTVEEFFGNWLGITKPSLAPRTQELYCQLLRNRIIPTPGNLKLKDLRPDHIQALYTKMIAV
jgi:integrase